MSPSTPSADPDDVFDVDDGFDADVVEDVEDVELPGELEAAADAAFRKRRVAQLRRRGRLAWTTWLAVGAVALVAVVITAHRSQPDDHVRAEALSPKIRNAAAPRQGATGCVGWPLSLTPSAKPPARQGAITIWGDRSAFHFRNVNDAPVVIEVAAQGGALRPVDADATQVNDGLLRFEMGPNSEARFTAACEVSGLTFTGTGPTGAALAEGAFELGTGPTDAPFVVTKVVRR